MGNEHRLVYSTHPEKFMKEEPAAGQPGGLPPLGPIKVRREKQGRAGKTVTALFEFQASDAQRGQLAKDLRKGIGTGGTVKDGVIELQGDHLNKVLALLTKLGYKPRHSGG